MKIKIKNEKLMAVMLTFIIALSSSSVVAFAWEHPGTAESVTLYSSQYKAYSGKKSDPYMYYEGKNTSSKQRVYFQMQYSANGESNWTDDVYILASPNAEVGKSTTNRRDSKPYWRLCLDAYGPVTGATAYGWTW